MQFIEKIANFLKQNSITFDMCGNELKDDPSNLVCLRDTGGFRSQGSTTRYPTVQILVRGDNYEVANIIAMAIFDLLNDKEFYWIEDIEIIASTATQEPAYLLTDTKKRVVITTNYHFTIRR